MSLIEDGVDPEHAGEDLSDLAARDLAAYCAKVLRGALPTDLEVFLIRARSERDDH